MQPATPVGWPVVMLKHWPPEYEANWLVVTPLVQSVGAPAAATGGVVGLVKVQHGVPMDGLKHPAAPVEAPAEVKHVPPGNWLRVLLGTCWVVVAPEVPGAQTQHA